MMRHMAENERLPKEPPCCQGNERILQFLKELSEKFDTHAALFLRHRREAKRAMRDIATMKMAMTSLSTNSTNLNHLPVIAQGITSLKDGLVQQNSALMNQNAQLIQPGSKAQNSLTYLSLAMVILVGLAVFIVLVRETKKDWNLTRDGISATERRVEHTETTREVMPSEPSKSR